MESWTNVNIRTDVTEAEPGIMNEKKRICNSSKEKKKKQLLVFIPAIGPTLIPIRHFFNPHKSSFF